MSLNYSQTCFSSITEGSLLEINIYKLNSQITETPIVLTSEQEKPRLDLCTRIGYFIKADETGIYLSTEIVSNNQTKTVQPNKENAFFITYDSISIVFQYPKSSTIPIYNHNLY